MYLAVRMKTHVCHSFYKETQNDFKKYIDNIISTFKSFER